MDTIRAVAAEMTVAAGSTNWPGPVSWAAEQVNWSDVAAVRLLGAVGGTLLLIAAIRAVFGRRGR